MQKPVGIGSERVLAGLAGRGIVESRSPWMHEQEADALGLRLVYALFDFSDRNWADEDLPKLLDATQRVGFSGINVTFPFKQAVVPLLDDLSDSARAVGAVNTVVFQQGRRIGHNTDCSGFAESFRVGLPDADLDCVLQVGCGGAGAATAHAVLAMPGTGTLLLHDTDHVRADTLCGQLQDVYGADRIALCNDPVVGARRASGLVNSTPMGMAKFPGLPLPADLIEARHWVADVVYFPLETEFLAAARAKGCRTLDGGGMAVNQAAEAFELFTDLRVDRQRMRNSFAAF